MISSTKRYYFAAILGTAALLTGLCANAFADADSISINFGPHFGAPTGGTLGAYPVNWSYWNNAISNPEIEINSTTEAGSTTNAYNKSGTFTSLLSSNGYQTPVTGTWNCNNTYRYGSERPSTNNNTILYFGYLDDGSGNNVVTMSSPYFAYDIYYYPTTDGNNSFRAVSIGGSNINTLEYGGNGSTTIPTKNYWGTPIHADIDALTEGVNYLKVPSTYSNVYVKGLGSENGHRGSFAALQIVNTADSQAVAVTGDFTWTDSVWTSDLTGETGQAPNASGVGYRIINNGTDATVNLGGSTVDLGKVKMLGTGKLTFADGTVTLGKTDAVYKFSDYGGQVELPSVGQIAPRGVVYFDSNVTTTNTTQAVSAIPGAYFVNGSTISFAKVEGGVISAVTPEYVAAPTDGMDLNVSTKITDNNDRTLNSITSSTDYVNSKALTITSGMMYFNNKNHWVQGGGTITSGYQNADGDNDLYIYGLGTATDMRINNSIIVDNPDNPNGKLNLIKTGSGSVGITIYPYNSNSSNTYTGKTVVLEGTLFFGGKIASTDFYVAPGARLHFGSLSNSGKNDYGDTDYYATSLSGYGRIEIGHSTTTSSLTLNNVVNDGSCFDTVYAYGKAFTLNNSQFHTQWLHSTTNITLNGNSEYYSNEFWGRGAGVLTINDTSTFTATTIFQLGTGAAAGTAGTVAKAVQNGGTVNLGNLGIGHYGNYDASYEMNAGVLNVGDSVTMNGSNEFKDIWLSVTSSGTFLHKGGTVNAGGIDLKTRDVNDMVGTYTMTGGTLNLGKRGFYRNVAGNYVIKLEGGTITSGSADLPESQRGNWSSALDATLTGKKTGDTDTRVTFAPAAGSSITWTGVLSGEGGLIYDGAGSMTISAGSTGNTYTGGTLVKSGTLTLTGTNEGYSSVGTGEVVIESGAKIVGQSSNVFGSRTITDARVPNVTINGGELEFNGYLHVNNMTLNGGTITNTNNDPEYAGLDFYDRNATMTVTEDTTISSKIINSSTLTIDVAEGKTLSLNSPMRNASGATCEFVKTGEGTISTTNWFGGGASVVIDEGAILLPNGFGDGNRVAGSITINENGTLIANGHDSLGYSSNAGTFNIVGGTLLKMDGNNETLANKTFNFTGGKITSSYTDDTGNVVNNDGWIDIFKTKTTFNSFAAEGASADNPTVATVDVRVRLRNDEPFAITAGENSKLVFTKEIFNGGSGVYSLTVNGDGVVEFQAANSYTGGTTINSGTLLLTENGTLGTGAIALNGGALEIGYDSDTTFTKDITGTGTLAKSGSGTLTISDAKSFTGNTAVKEGKLLVSGAGTLGTEPGDITVADGASLEFVVDEGDVKRTGAVSGKGSVLKTGPGTLQIDNSAYVDGYDESVQFGTITAKDGRLDVKGVYEGTFVIDAPAIFSPGNSIGTLKTDVFQLNAGATLLMEQDATGMDTLIANTFIIDDDAIVEYVFTSIQPGATYEIFNDPNGLEGQYADVNYWASFLTPGDDYYWNISIVDNSVFASVDPNAVPEPSTWALLILGALGLLYWRKKNA
ncbi:MAG: autotransporter-associated beta strand repeat-containing protein [Thermoguttaceae bacterium]|nr:autotransporter-associated beta strand repeat-containing protein [Thermoguttaceae bacterium]